MGNEKVRAQRALHHLGWILEALKLCSPVLPTPSIFNWLRLK
jgi:hypothetical protein